MSEDHEVLGAGTRGKGNTHNNSDCDTTMDLVFSDIDKMIRMHGEPYVRQLTNITLEEAKLFTRAFINICKNHPNEPQNIPTDITNN